MAAFPATWKESSALLDARAELVAKMHVMMHVASALCKDAYGGLAHPADGLAEVLVVVGRLRDVRDPAARPGDMLGALVSGWGISGPQPSVPRSFVTERLPRKSGRRRG